MNNLKRSKKANGITLIALIITIVVLLILAVVTINAVQDGGIIGHAKNATSKYKEGQIIEKIKLAITETKLRGLGTLQIPYLEEELTEQFGVDNYELVLVGEDYIIVVESVQYKISTGESNTIESAEIEYAGDPTKNKQYDGMTTDTAFKITCIEDLVEWSNNYSKYYGYIELERTLDFKDTSSYNDFNAKITDINGNGEIEALITELTTGTGFKPIPSFKGTFDGKGNAIRNIYVNTTGSAGLFASFASANNTTITDLGVTGVIKTTGELKSAGGIAGTTGIGGSTIIKNCYSNCTVSGLRCSGGIVGLLQSDSAIIDSCYNLGTVWDVEQCRWYSWCTGGNNGIMLNCYNLGKIRLFRESNSPCLGWWPTWKCACKYDVHKLF